jgi:hypothetical protein
MAKKKAKNQIANLILDHKKSGIDLIYLFIEGVRHTVEKFLMKAATLL